MKKVHGIFILLFIAFFFRHDTYAQTPPTGLSISPPFAQIILEKKDKYVYDLEITNNTAVHQTIRLAVADFGSLDESGGVAFIGSPSVQGEQKYALASWMSLEKDVVELASQSKKTVEVTILNKDSLSPGGHYGAILSSFGSPDPNSVVSVRATFASLLFVKKVGGEIYKLELAGSNVISRWLGFPTDITLRFQNTGNVHVVPRGTVTVTGPWDWEIYKGIINQASGIILPESFRVYPTSLERLSFPIWPGMYELTVRYRYDTQNEYVIQITRFFHPGLVGIVLIACMILFTLLRLTSFARECLAKLKS